MNTGREINLFKNLILGSFYTCFGIMITLGGYMVAKLGRAWWCLLPYLVFCGAPLIAYGLEGVVLFIRSNRRQAAKCRCKQCDWDWEQWVDWRNEAKCPKCCSHKVMTKPVRLDAETKLPFNFIKDIYLPIMVLILGVAVTWIIIFVTQQWPVDNTTQWTFFGRIVDPQAIMALGTGSYFVFGSLASINRYSNKKSIRRLYHHCAACGNSWTVTHT